MSRLSAAAAARADAVRHMRLSGIRAADVALATGALRARAGVRFRRPGAVDPSSGAGRNLLGGHRSTGALSDRLEVPDGETKGVATP